MSKSILPCGCQRGEFLCPVADALWVAAEAVYLKARQSQESDDWKAWEAGRAKYEEHFASQEVVNVLLC